MIPPPGGTRGGGGNPQSIGEEQRVGEGLVFVSSCRERKEAGRKQTRENAERDGIESSAEERPRERRLKAITKIRNNNKQPSKPSGDARRNPSSLPPPHFPAPSLSSYPWDSSQLVPRSPAFPRSLLLSPSLSPLPAAWRPCRAPLGSSLMSPAGGVACPGRVGMQRKQKGTRKEAERSAGWGN